MAVALVAAFALPALLLASGPLFRTAASDQIAVGVVEPLDPTDAGVVVQSGGPLDTETLPPFDAELRDRLGTIAGLDEAQLTLLTDEIRLGSVAGREVDTGPGPGDVRMMTRPGAAEAVELIAGDAGDDGVLVPAHLADEHGIEPGATIGLGGVEVRVGGVYRDLWDGDRDAFWDRLPYDIAPRFVGPFDEPNFELVIASADTTTSLGTIGRARWETPLVEPPATWDALDGLEREYRRLDGDLAATGPLNDAYRAWASLPDDPPSSFSALTPARDDAARVIAELEAPIRTSTQAGTLVGLLLSTLGAVFLLRRHRTEFRLLAADGDAAWRFFGRALAQYLVPAAAGLVVGTALGVAAVRWLGPSGTATWDVVPIGALVIVSIVGVVAAAAVTAALAVRLTDALEAPIGALRPAWVVVLLGVAITMWVQIGRERTGEVNPLIVAFPFVGVVTGVLLAVLILRWALRRMRRSGGRLPTPLFLAWRALTASETGALALTAAIGAATGLAVLSISFVGSIDRATSAKSTTIAGAVSRLDTIDPVDLDELPDGSTVVFRRTTRVATGTVDVVAIDPDTFTDAVAWSETFGRSPDDLVALLGDGGAEDLDAVPAVAVGAIPAAGDFGFQRVIPYRLVGTMPSVPTASATTPTLVVRADVLERFARERFDELVDPIDVEAAEATGRTVEYESPLRAFGNTVLSTRPLDEIAAIGERLGWRVSDTYTLAGQAGDVEALATRWAFDYLGLLAVVGIVAASGVLTFYLAERRRSREVTTVMTTQMGIARQTNVLAAIVEMVGLVIAAIASGALAATVTARRVFPSFEPDPAVPPTVGLDLDTTTIGLVLIAAIVVVAAVAAWSERRVSTADAARVLRG